MTATLRTARIALWLVFLLPNAPAAPARPAGRIGTAGGRPTLEEALKLAFPGCRIERRTIYLTKEEKKRAGKLAGVEIQGGIVRPYVATRKGELVGTAYFDSHPVRTLRETLLIAVDPEGRIRRIELFAFGEPREYVPRGGWYAQFRGRKLDGDLRLERGIKGVSGATLTARATTKAVRRVLALHAVIGERKPPRDPGSPSGG